MGYGEGTEDELFVVGRMSLLYIYLHPRPMSLLENLPLSGLTEPEGRDTKHEEGEGRICARL